MNTCDTCKWWSVVKFESEPIYAKPYEAGELHLCNNPKLESYTEDGLSVETDSPSAILTGGKFGCIHWESK